MARDGTPYRGVLYAGLILTPAGPMVLEFNVRFGDPEAQVILPVIDGDLAGALEAVARGAAGDAREALVVGDRAAVAVVLASPGYPDAPVGGLPLLGAEPAEPADDPDVLFFHGATTVERGRWKAPAGRAVTAVGLGRDLASARERAYAGLSGVDLPGGQYRSDIALYP
jgi:phosphoribosylamine--glycine ligase